jgi:hypothetical protein
MYYQKLPISIVALVAVLLLPFFLFAEVRTSTDTEGADRGDAAGYEEIQTTTITTSDREADLCDGVMCPDGNCVRTIEECPITETDVTGVGTMPTRDGTGVSIVPIRADIEPASRPDYLDTDDDGDSIPTAAETDRATPYMMQEATERDREQGGNEAGSVRRSDEDVADEDEVIEKAQDYNSSRSNKRGGVFEGVDLDSVPEVARTRAGFIKIDGVNGESTNTQASENEESLWCWGRAEAADGTEYRWGRGLCIALAAMENADDAARDRISALLVQGDEVRGWSEEERDAWRAYRADRSEVEDVDERLIEHMIERAQEDERIQEMRADDAGVEMRYQTTLRLFGFIPLQRTITARMDMESVEPKLDLPWYSFLTTKPEKETIRTLVLDTMDILVLVPARAS